MDKIARRELYGPAGELLLRVGTSDRAQSLLDHPAVRGHRALTRACGGSPQPASRRVTRGDVVSAAVDLGLVARAPLKGFFTVLPAGVLLDRCVETFNGEHVQALAAVRMEFPHLFGRDDPRVAELTADYEAQDRMFRIDRDLRLAYAADPGYFSWLTGARLREQALPFAVYTPMRVFRRWLAGELGGFDRLPEYTLPDVHIAVTPEAEIRCATDFMRLAAEGARFWAGDDITPFVEVVRDYADAHPDLGPSLAAAARSPLLLTVLQQRPRYYAVKSGVLVDAGFGNVMLYNLQIDDTNGPRFDIRTTAGGDVTIVHGTLAGGWAKVLPILLGRGLSGLAPRAIPAEVAATQIVCLPLREAHTARATAYVQTLCERGVRAGLEMRTDWSLGKRVRGLRQRWQPHHAIVGDREFEAEPVISSTFTGERATFDNWLGAHRSRLERCRPPGPSLPPADLPF